MSTSQRQLMLALIEVTRTRPEAPEYQKLSAVLVGRAEKRASALGWNVVRRAADIGTEELLAETADADAVLIMGGEDLSPHLYGRSDGYPNEGVHRPIADEAQLALVRRAADWRVPVLGICRGHQLINVAFGGTLIPDISTDFSHRNDFASIEQCFITHDVVLDQDSALSGALGPGATRSVQSAHHQAIDEVGTGLVAVAWADDGIIEGVEHVGLPIIGVQWHPEAPAASDSDLDLLLELLVDQVTAGDTTRPLSVTSRVA